MDIEKVKSAQSQEEAREYAIEWQAWQEEQNLSFGELVIWMEIFETLAQEFDLVDEFKENGVI